MTVNVNTAFRIATETNPLRMARVKAMLDLDSNKEQEMYRKAIAELEEKKKKAFDAVVQKYLPETTKIFEEAQAMIIEELEKSFKERNKRS